MAVRFKNESQRYYPVWENIVLFEAKDGDEAMKKAEERGRSEEGDCDGSFTWGERPSEWFFAGIRRLISCQDEEERPANATEVTYSEWILESRAALDKFAAGGRAPLLAEWNEDDDEES